MYNDLIFRGLIHQVTDAQFDKVLEKWDGKNNSLTLYAGFDPTSDSLHLGHLLPLLTLKRFQMAGHKPIAITGGATGMIGDPSGKASERLLLTKEPLEKNLIGIRKQITHVLGSDAIIIDNNSWLENFGYLEFLRDVGKHFTVNYMMAKESVKGRLEDRGISYTEFSYMLLQAYDFYHLYRHYGCTLQIGGSDQWGNITAGCEFIRRMEAGKKLQNPEPNVYGLTQPLVTKTDGSKFGKTESGAIWLDPAKTSPYQFYQYFMGVHDSDVILFLKYFTFLSHDEILSLEVSVKTEPEKRLAQTRLAQALTGLIHGEEELKKVQLATSALFGTEIKTLDEQALLSVFHEAPSTKKNRSELNAGLAVVDLLVESRLCKSKGMARQDIQGGGIYVNNERIADVAATVDEARLIADKFIVLRKGKKTYHLISFLKLVVFLLFFSHATFAASDFFKVKEFDLPTLVPEGDFEVYKTGLQNEVRHCKRVKRPRDGAKINFDGRYYTVKDWCIKTGGRLLEIAKSSNGFADFYSKVKTGFDFYKSKGNHLGDVSYTGYYSPTLELTLKGSATNPYPVYKKPLVFKKYTRKEIDEDGALKGKGLEIGYAQDLFDVFVFQVQGAGSAVFVDKNGVAIRHKFLNFAAQNGHPYKSIRKILTDRGVAEEYLTLDGIRKWFKEHPDEIKNVLYESPSYVFFKVDDKGPMGSTSTVLSSGHSIAIDRQFNPLSGMALVSSQKPVLDKDNLVVGWQDFTRFAIANDTGGAIKGAGRVDFFWGDSSYAKVAAGNMNMISGELYFILPRP